MKLVIASPSPFARKVRVALHEKRIDFDEVVDVPWNANTVAPSLNPLGKIPVLAFDDGRVFYDSSVIVEFLDTLDAEPRLIPADPSARLAVRQIETLADGICDAVVLTVLEQARRPDMQSTNWIDRQCEKVTAGTQALAALLGDGVWFHGETMTLADIAVGCCLGYIDLRMPQNEWRRPYPNLDAFSARMEARPSFMRSKPEVQAIEPVG